MSDAKNGANRESASASERDVDSTSQRFFGRARELAGSMAAPIWLWNCTFVGSRARTIGKPRILNRGRIEIRDNVVIDSRFSRTELVTAPGGQIVIGTGTRIEHGAMLVANRLVELGDRVTLGPYCIVSDSDSPDLGARECGDARPIWIGDEVVIGTRVTVMPGAMIGARSQILPGSIVSGEIPPGVVAGGNPARSIRKLRPVTATLDVQVPAVLGLAVDVVHGARR